MVTVLLELERACSQNRWLAIQNKRRGWGKMGHVTLDWLLQGKKNKGLLNTAYIYASRGNLWLQDS